MCTSCVSSAEALVISAAAGVAVLQGAAHRVADALAGRHPAARAAAAWDANATFARSLGLDPALVLGDRPAVPAPVIEVGGLAGTGLVGALV